MNNDRNNSKEGPKKVSEETLKKVENLAKKLLRRGGIPDCHQDEPIQEAFLACLEGYRAEWVIKRWIIDYYERTSTNMPFKEMEHSEHGKIIIGGTSEAEGSVRFTKPFSVQPWEIVYAKDSRMCPRCCSDKIEVVNGTPSDEEGIGGDIAYCPECHFSYCTDIFILNRFFIGGHHKNT